MTAGRLLEAITTPHPPRSLIMNNEAQSEAPDLLRHTREEEKKNTEKKTRKN
jgi:hypothetical protein